MCCAAFSGFGAALRSRSASVRGMIPNSVIHDDLHLHCYVCQSPAPFSIYPSRWVGLDMDGGFMERENNASAAMLRVVGIVFSRKIVGLMSCVFERGEIGRLPSRDIFCAVSVLENRI